MCKRWDTPTLAGMLGATLIRNEVVEVCQPRQKCLLTATRMMESLHHEEFPVDGVVDLVQQRAAGRHLWVFEYRIPPGFGG